MAEDLGRGSLNAVQIFKVLVEEAERSHQVTRLVRGTLVRELCERLPDGWPATLDGPNRVKVALALSSWSAFTPETHLERVDRAGDVLLANPPPPGWLPKDPDDELLRTLIPDDEA